MARPVVFQIRITEAEQAALKAVAGVAGLSVSEFARQALSKASSIAQEASGDEQATETPGSDAAMARGLAHESEVDSQILAREAAAWQELGEQSFSERNENGSRAASPDDSAGRGHGGVRHQDLGTAAPIVSKPTVNEALGNKSGDFRVSPKCQNQRCARLKMALCEPCRQANK